MPVSIRLSRVGTKHVPFYRVVVVDSRKKRDGEVLENIGTYDGLKSSLVTFKPERYDAWVKLGAQPSATAKKLYRLFQKKQGAAPVVEPAPQKKVKQAAADTKVKIEQEGTPDKKQSVPTDKDTSE